MLKIIRDNEHIIIDFNVEDQLFERGVGSDGKKLKPDYIPFTVQRKKEKNQPYNRVTLRDTEAFHEGIFIDTGKFPVVFGSQDWKEKKLVEKYGINLFGVTVKNRKEVSLVYIKPELITFLKTNM